MKFHISVNWSTLDFWLVAFQDIIVVKFLSGNIYNMSMEKFLLLLISMVMTIAVQSCLISVNRMARQTDMCNFSEYKFVRGSTNTITRCVYKAIEMFLHVCVHTLTIFSTGKSFQHVAKMYVQCLWCELNIYACKTVYVNLCTHAMPQTYSTS